MFRYVQSTMLTIASIDCNAWPTPNHCVRFKRNLRSRWLLRWLLHWLLTTLLRNSNCVTDHLPTAYLITRLLGPWKFWKVLELGKKSSRPWKVLKFGSQSLKILEWVKKSFLTSKNNTNKLFVKTKTATPLGLIFVQKQIS